MFARFLSVVAAILIALSAFPVVAHDGVSFLNPEGLFKPSTFSQIAISEGDVMVFISGQTARDADSKLVGAGDVKKQTEKALDNIRIAIESLGGSMGDIAKITTYIVDLKPEDRFWIGAMVGDFFPRPPAHTLIGISALAAPELLVEIEAIAVLD